MIFGRKLKDRVWVKVTRNILSGALCCLLCITVCKAAPPPANTSGLFYEQAGVIMYIDNVKSQNIWAMATIFVSKVFIELYID